MSTFESRPAPPSAKPFEPDEIAGLFAPYAALSGRSAVLAVSGGVDSIALMSLFAAWCRQACRATASMHVATVDHGLRPGSTSDADFVVEAARALGFQAHMLAWCGPKPATGKAEAAREARYRLLADLMQQVGAPLLFTAHTEDDQAETVLMRLARGSGVDGLAGMSPLRRINGVHGLWLGRPLLQVSKARLAAHLAAAGIPWREDPTNLDPAYERPRLREARAALEDLGLTAANIALSARRLRRAREALEEKADAVFCTPAVTVHPWGYVDIDVAELLKNPDDIGLRVLQRALEIAGGARAPISLGRLEALFETVNGGGGHGRTLGHAVLSRRGTRLRIERETGRSLASQSFPIRAATTHLWDGRFVVEVRKASPNLELGPLGPDGLAALESKGHPRPAAPARTLHALPALWRDGQPVAVPLIGYVEPSPLQLDVRMTLLAAAGSAAPGHVEAGS